MRNERMDGRLGDSREEWREPSSSFKANCVCVRAVSVGLFTTAQLPTTERRRREWENVVETN